MAAAVCNRGGVECAAKSCKHCLNLRKMCHMLEEVRVQGKGVLCVVLDISSSMSWVPGRFPVCYPSCVYGYSSCDCFPCCRSCKILCAALPKSGHMRL